MERKTYPLMVGDELWDAYTSTVTRSQTLEQPLIRFIIDRIIDVHGRDEVPDVYLAWYDGDLEEFPKPFAKPWLDEYDDEDGDEDDDPADHPDQTRL